MNLTALPLQFWTQGRPAKPDRTTQLAMETSACQRFFTRCDRITQELLIRCKWNITLNAKYPILKISCPSTVLYWQVVQILEALGEALEKTLEHARIQLYRPLDKGIPLEVRVDELSRS